MRKAQASDEVRELIELRLKAQHDEATRLYYARQEGLQEGLREGLQEGRREMQVQTARQMLEAGLDWASITRFTGVVPGDLES
jgi:predicted transposase/invertase (TIGR01784 family)